MQCFSGLQARSAFVSTVNMAWVAGVGHAHLVGVLQLLLFVVQLRLIGHVGLEDGRRAALLEVLQGLRELELRDRHVRVSLSENHERGRNRGPKKTRRAMLHYVTYNVLQ